MIEILDKLAAELNCMRFSAPVTHVYNPLIYARAGMQRYLSLYGHGQRETLLVGMNPGPWGMAQTGVPFGDVGLVSQWLGIRTAIGQPNNPHPKRPVLGFDGTRGEASGQRLWGWARQRFATPRHFFERFFVTNYCPLMFIEAGGRNRTPDKLPPAERLPLIAACDIALQDTVRHLQPQWVIGIGLFAAQRCAAALKDMPVTIGRMPHPSPASPLANRGWAEQAERHLTEIGIFLSK